ncbi:MAG TPA: 23S rRNA (adenine(2503)-C(2))-methyltransferase RlmN, partial [Actinomycetes bacterium]|nr:23S rRNA (adenine(2503)-C(2))-methyltransferase RlmN [Actinomycetes bacterium]
MVRPAPHPLTGARPAAAGPRSLYDLEAAGLARLVEETGEPSYRARQLARWLDRRKVADLEAMTDLPAGFRARLGERLAGVGLTLDRHQVGDSGWTHKFLFGLPGGDSVESVLMLYPPAGQGTEHDGGEWETGSPSGRQGRATLCVSTQAGCAMGCTFCATGQFGFSRNLSTGEVVEQVARVWSLLGRLRPAPSAPGHLTNVVFMGMGEPFANPTATWGAAWRLHQGLGLSARAITISTVGLVPGIRRAAREALPVNLAVSIHAATDELRDRLVPVNRSWPIGELLEAVRAYVAATRRRVSFEYALIRDLNDGLDQADELGRLLAPLRVPRSGGHAAHVNLIPYNPTPGLDLRTPSRGAVRRFRDAVAAHGLPVSVRANRGVGIDAACGQLRTVAGRPGRGSGSPPPR